MDPHLVVWLLLPAALGSPYTEDRLNAEFSIVELCEDTAVKEEEYKEAFEFKHDDVFQLILHSKTFRGNMTECTHYFPLNEDISSHLKFPDGLLSLKNVFCLIYNQRQFCCNWSAKTFPTKAPLTFTVLQNAERDKTWNCSTSYNNEVVECSGTINPDKTLMTIQINMSLPDLQYLYSRHYEIKKNEKLNPPHNISMSITNGTLKIEWNTPEKIKKECVHYQLRLNNGTEYVNVTAGTKYTKANVDLTRKQSVQIRVTKREHCWKNDIWSNWSNVVVLDAAVKPNGINVLVIVGMALGIPMILLALLLFCRFHRIHEKMFPPIPSPSKKTKIMLEREDLFQVFKTKHTEEIHEAESVTVVECVKVPN
ncbi:interleukin-13 receptor subunit alpha-1-like [Arapaima gigas]